MYPPKLHKYKVGEVVFIKDPLKEQILSRQIFKIDNKRCVLYNKNMYRLVKKVKNKVQSLDFYTITFYKKLIDVN